MKKHWIVAITLVLGSLEGAFAIERWVPGTPQGAKVEFVGLDFRPEIVERRYGSSNAMMELGLDGEDSVFTLYYWSYIASYVPVVYQSLLDARMDNVGVNILIDSATNEILAVRIGETGQPLAIRGSRAGAAWDRGVGGDGGIGGKARFDLLGRKAAVAAKTAAGMRIRDRAASAR